jgi:hypothetical protein
MLDAILADWESFHAATMETLETLIREAREACEGIEEPERKVSDWIEREFREIG